MAGESHAVCLGVQQKYIVRLQALGSMSCHKGDLQVGAPGKGHLRPPQGSVVLIGKSTVPIQHFYIKSVSSQEQYRALLRQFPQPFGKKFHCVGLRIPCDLLHRKAPILNGAAQLLLILLGVFHNKAAADGDQALRKPIGCFNAANGRGTPVFFKVEDKANIAAVKAVNALPVVPYAEKIIVLLLAHCLQQTVARLGDILILVNNHIAIWVAILPALDIRGRHIDHVVEIDLIAFAQHRLVAAVNWLDHIYHRINAGQIF